MARWKRVISQAEGHRDRKGDRSGDRQDRVGDELMIQNYLGYGTKARIYVRGRVLEDKGITGAGEDDSLWQNFKDAYKRFRSNEIPHARLTVQLEGQRHEITTDDEGYYGAWFDLPAEPDTGDDDLLEVTLHLHEPLGKAQREVVAQEAVLIPKGSAAFGVISDIDDTILQTGATNLLSMAKKVLFGNARTRLPFAGIPTLYNALNEGGKPIFYVSSSPWNLYDVLVEFLELNDIPLGPLTLRNWGWSPENLPFSHGSHKLEAIREVMDTYPTLPFILIGDSGQEDPEIYRDVVHDHGGHILGVYIRDVHHHKERSKEIQALKDEVQAAGSFLALVEDSVEAAEHAAAEGFIDAERVAEVVAAKADNEQEAAL